MLSIALFIPLVGLIIDKNYLERFEFLQIYILKLNEYTNLDIFYILIFILVIIFIVKNIIILGLNYYSDKSAYDTRKEIGNKIMQNYLQSNYEFYLIKDSSLIFYMLTEGVASFGHMLLSLMRLFTNILITIFIFIFILYHYPDQLILLSLSAFLGGGLYYFFTKNFMGAFGKRRVLAENKYYKNLRESLDFLKEIKIYNKENLFGKLHMSNNKEIIRNSIIWSFVRGVPKVWFELVAVFSLFIVLSFNYMNALDTQEIIISLSVMIYAIARTLPSVNTIIASLQTLKFSEYLFNQIKDLRDLNLKKSNYNNFKQENFEKFSSLEIQDLSFSYPNRDAVLKNLNFKMTKGEIIGIVGESGSGKSTLLNLIIGLFKMQKGKYFINQKLVSDIRTAKSNLFGYIPQKINLLDDNIKNNIALEIDKIDQKALDESISRSELKNLISQLADKENTKVGEKGSNLSGGQAQRIAIARALYQNPEILIMDEATNSLDTELEKNILKTLKKLDKSLLMVSHNLETLEICDRIYRLDNKTLKIIS